MAGLGQASRQSRKGPIIVDLQAALKASPDRHQYRPLISIPTQDMTAYEPWSHVTLGQLCRLLCNMEYNTYQTTTLVDFMIEYEPDAGLSDSHAGSCRLILKGTFAAST